MRQHKGFTLLEIMIAIVILGIAIIPMAGMFTTAQLGFVMGSESTVAIGEAQSIIEGYRLQHLQGQLLTSVARTEIIDQPGYEYTVGVSPEINNLTEVTVTVYYSIKGKERSLSLVTRMGDGWQ